MQLTDPPAVDVTEIMPTEPEDCGFRIVDCGLAGPPSCRRTPIDRIRNPQSAIMAPHKSHPALPIPPARPAALTHWRAREYRPAPIDRLSSPPSHTRCSCAAA